jgi:hypothetical protein
MLTRLAESQVSTNNQINALTQLMEAQIKATSTSSGDRGYFKKIESFKKIEPFSKINSFGCYDFETFTLNDGLQRAYYLLVYHPLKVKSEEKFKSQHLLTLTGEQTTIEILGERKKAMGPDSLIDGKMYSKVRVRITTIQHLPILFQERNSYRS